jgi:hypothetical protein
MGSFIDYTTYTLSYTTIEFKTGRSTSTFRARKTFKIMKNVFFGYFYLVSHICICALITDILWFIHSFGELWQPPLQKLQPDPKVMGLQIRKWWLKQKGANPTFVGVV